MHCLCLGFLFFPRSTMPWTKRRAAAVEIAEIVTAAEEVVTVETATAAMVAVTVAAMHRGPGRGHGAEAQGATMEL